jgi:FkbM family methyltransferase
MLGFLRSLVERAWPPLAVAFRAARDSFALARLRPAVTPHGFRFIGPPSMQRGEFESAEAGLIRDLVGPGTVFIDAGAHFGLFTCLARSLGARTLAFEPNDSNVQVLYRNLMENGWSDVEVYPVALGSAPAVSWLYGSGTGSSLVSGWAGAGQGFRRGAAVSTLDLLVGSRFDDAEMVVKVDVEGAEFDLLQGAGRVAGGARRTWIVEINLREHHPRGRNARFLETFEFFWERGYVASSIGATPEAVTRARVMEWLSSPLATPPGRNFQFVRT